MIDAPFFQHGPRADELAMRMWGLGIECPLGISSVKERVVLESPCRLIGGVENWAVTEVGAFSYAWSRISPSVRSIGRYCSIAGQIVLGETEHSTDCLTTSSFIYDAGWMWGEFAVAHGERHHPFMGSPRSRDITIGNDVWIGAGAYIKGGVTLGDGCVVGARAVVTKDVPPYGIVVGNPARLVRFRFDEAIIAELLEFRWWRFSFINLNGMKLDRVRETLAQLRDAERAGRITPYVPQKVQLLSPRAMEAINREGQPVG